MQTTSKKTEKALGILVTVDGAVTIPATATLIPFMAARGHRFLGYTEIGSYLRPELQGKPRFAGLCGPMWGGEDTPLRYEDAEMNDLLSR